MATGSSLWGKSKHVPQVHIELSIPRRIEDFSVSSNTYQQDLSTFPQAPMNQKMDLRVSVLPWDKRIFDMSPMLYLYRYTSRSKRDDLDFREWGKKRVHPADSRNPHNGHRYWGGSHSNPYLLLDRITEEPLNTNTHANGQKEFYWGSSANPDGTIFQFNPLAWFSMCKDIEANGVTFPQPLNQGNSGWTFNAWVGIENWVVQIPWGTTFEFAYTGRNKKRSRGRNPKRQFFGIQLMVANPDYTTGSQTPKYLTASNEVQFVLDYKIATLIDPVDSIIRKYAIDWRIRPNNAL